MRHDSALAVVLLGGCVAAMGAQTVAIHGGNGVVLGPPPAVAIKPVTDKVGGRDLTDNYRWLEDQKAPDTRAFIQAEQRYTDTYFCADQAVAGSVGEAADRDAAR